MPSVSLINTQPAPKLIFKPTVFEEIRYIVNRESEEVGWLFTVDRNDAGDFIVDEVFVPEQEVDATETDIEPQALLDWFNILEEKGKDPANRMCGWGHSHVNMGIEPSPQDDGQLLRYGESSRYFIRTIHNKKGDIRVDIAMFEENLMYSRCDWLVQYAELSDIEQKRIDTMLDQNVKKTPYGNIGYVTGGYGKYGKRGKYNRLPAPKNKKPKELNKLYNDEYSELFGGSYLGDEGYD